MKVWHRRYWEVSPGLDAFPGAGEGQCAPLSLPWMFLICSFHNFTLRQLLISLLIHSLNGTWLSNAWSCTWIKVVLVLLCYSLEKTGQFSQREGILPQILIHEKPASINEVIARDEIWSKIKPDIFKHWEFLYRSNFLLYSL